MNLISFRISCSLRLLLFIIIDNLINKSVLEWSRCIRFFFNHLHAYWRRMIIRWLLKSYYFSHINDNYYFLRITCYSALIHVNKYDRTYTQRAANFKCSNWYWVIRHIKYDKVEWQRKRGNFASYLTLRYAFFLFNESTVFLSAQERISQTAIEWRRPKVTVDVHFEGIESNEKRTTYYPKDNFLWCISVVDSGWISL